MAREEIRIQSFNPYECRYPGRRVILWELLQLVKALRSQGYVVRVLPEDGTRLNWRQENGLRDVLQDPVTLTLISIPISVATSLLANLVWDRFGRWRDRKRAPIVIVVPAGRSAGKYDIFGNRISNWYESSSTLGERESSHWYWKTRLQSSPYPTFPEPILLEHTARIVGWGRVSVDDVGLLVEARIDDFEIQQKLDSGELGGFSFGALIYDSRCSICGKQYVDCGHTSGNCYDGVKCIAHIKGADFAEISVVQRPASPDARARRVR